MKIRFYVTQKSLAAAGLYVAYLQNKTQGIFVEGSYVCLAALSQTGTQLYFEDTEIADERIWLAVVKMSVRSGEKSLLVYGDYSAERWFASISPYTLGDTKSVIELTTKTMMTVPELESIYHELVHGKHLPQAAVRDQVLTSRQVADLVMDLGHIELPHWLSIIQGAQNAVLDASNGMRLLSRRVHELEVLLQKNGIDPQSGVHMITS
jgi:hypothetical protein